MGCSRSPASPPPVSVTWPSLTASQCTSSPPGAPHSKTPSWNSPPTASTTWPETSHDTVRTAARPLDLVAAEWIKLRSLRSTYLVLLTGVAAAFAIGLLVCNADAGQWTHVRPGQPSPVDPMAASFVGFSVAQLL